MQQKKHTRLFLLAGALAGVLNGLLGAAGGMAVLLLLRRCNWPPERLHATALAILLPVCACSAGYYLLQGNLPVSYLWLLLPGLAGSVLGCILLQKVSARFLNLLLAVLLFVSGMRIFWGGITG